MEVTPTEGLFAPDPSHPDFPRWQAAVDRAVLRGEAVTHLVRTRREVRGLWILDLGSGVGGTVEALLKAGAHAIAFDRDGRRLRRIRHVLPTVPALQGDAGRLPFSTASFDGVIMQDVIEHLREPETVLREVARILKPGGFLYLSTPLKWALPNLVADPHWGLPLLSCQDLEGVRRRLASRRPRDVHREDLAVLLGGKPLMHLLKEVGFDSHLILREAVDALFHQPSAYVWTPWQERVVNRISGSVFRGYVRRWIKNRPTLAMRLFVPTWYLFCTTSTLAKGLRS